MARKPKLSPEALAFFREQGKIGGMAGGAKAWEGLTPEQKSERARRAVAARKWRKVKEKDGVKAAGAASRKKTTPAADKKNATAKKSRA